MCPFLIFSVHLEFLFDICSPHTLFNNSPRPPYALPILQPGYSSPLPAHHHGILVRVWPFVDNILIIDRDDHKQGVGSSCNLGQHDLNVKTLTLPPPA
jgi:hypothetical protein